MALMAYRVCTQLRTNADQVDSITSTNLHLAGLAVNQLENRLHLLHLDASEENTYRQIFLLRIGHHSYEIRSRLRENGTHIRYLTFSK